MIKLMEILQKGENNVRDNWQLREVLINPEFIIKMFPDETFKQKCVSKTLYGLDNLDKEQQFTRIIFDKTSLVAVGSLDQINEKIHSSKKLLKG